MALQLLPSELLSAYRQLAPKDMEEAFERLHEAPISTFQFSFYTSVASVFSSKIE